MDIEYPEQGLPYRKNFSLAIVALPRPQNLLVDKGLFLDAYGMTEGRVEVGFIVSFRMTSNLCNPV
ncbi:MAG: hypothetical protein QM642_08395 [Edaphocola sp.]